MFLYVCRQIFHKLYGYVTREFLGLRMRNFQALFLYEHRYIGKCLNLHQCTFTSFGNLWGNSYTKFTIHRFHVLFHLYLIESAPKQCKVPRYYDQDCLVNFFWPSTLPMMIQISEENAHLVQKIISMKKLLISNGENSLESYFDLN